ncbi:MAG: zinc ABC transporter substrate-binding protein [Betaproteobacteria bacterium HGW-Betaproteobacteria-11]|nr:MAG: zinc ABC transporter substrate-binding protein [Betaproteobacteria bacterium HGW-Betaproteobacteria-11]
MKRLFTLVMFLLIVSPAWAALKVFATVPEWGALTEAIGGSEVEVFVATGGLQDPHRIQAKPSLIARARNADLLIATGAELEVGWLPLVQRESANPSIQSGQPGYFEAARYVSLLEKPARLDRAEGDVHAAGNPHIQTDPRNFLRVGRALAERLAQLDPAHAALYAANEKRFRERLTEAITRWEKAAAPLRGVPILVQHKAFPYLENWLGLNQLGSLEAKPGMEPTSGQLEAVLSRQRQQPAKMVLRPAYQYDAPSRWLAERTKINVVILPFTIGGTNEARDIFSLFDDTVRRLLQGMEVR